PRVGAADDRRVTVRAVALDEPRAAVVRELRRVEVDPLVVLAGRDEDAAVPPVVRRGRERGQRAADRAHRARAAARGSIVAGPRAASAPRIGRMGLARLPGLRSSPAAALTWNTGPEASSWRIVSAATVIGSVVKSPPSSRPST